MSLFRPSGGPTRAAPPYFPYRDHGTLSDVWAGRGGMNSVPRIAAKKAWCEQCQRTVSAAESQICRSPFCKGPK